MRRADREVRDSGRIQEILDLCKVCRLGLNDDGEVYIVPMNYGYVFQGGQLTLYVHCASEGRRLSILEKNAKVGVEMDAGHALTGAGDVPCRYSYRFVSLIGTGIVAQVEKPAEKIAALGRIMHCQTGREFSFTEDMVQGTTVLQVTVEQFSCKEHE